MACALFLALRTLRQLAHDEQQGYPLGAQALLQNMYVDDVLASASSESEALSLQQEISGILSTAGFQLRKWASNSTEVLARIPLEHQEPLIKFESSDDPSVSILGLCWHPMSDTCTFMIQPSRSTSVVTMRIILSNIARIYDPLGWLGPVVIKAKSLLQTLWLQGVTCDEPLPLFIAEKWDSFCRQLPMLTSVLIPRWYGLHDNNIGYELHGFADASESAYAAVLYIRILNDADQVRISILVAKTKVAPVKRLSIPRLELCAVHFLSRLVQFVRRSLTLTTTPVHLWTDSMVALTWIQGHPARWKTFVANRVSDIHHKAPDVMWRHVPTADNPADCASRELSPEQLGSHHLWCTGPNGYPDIPHAGLKPFLQRSSKSTWKSAYLHIAVVNLTLP